MLGELTDVGRQVYFSSIVFHITSLNNALQSTYSLGRSLRKLYVEKYVSMRVLKISNILSSSIYRLGFLPDTLTNMDDVYFRYGSIMVVTGHLLKRTFSGQQTCRGQ